MDFTLISRCPVLHGISPEELETLFNDIHYNIKTFNKDNLVLNAGETCNGLMILVSGQVRGEVLDFTGNPVKIEDISAPRPLAPAFLFGKQNICPVTVIASDKARVLFIPKADVLRLFQKAPIILENYLDIITSRGQFLLQKVKLLTLKNLNQRIAYFLIKNSEVLNSKKFTQREIAEILGVARPSLARTLAQMEDENILSYNKGRIRILDQTKLKLLLQNFHD